MATEEFERDVRIFHMSRVYPDGGAPEGRSGSSYSHLLANIQAVFPSMPGEIKDAMDEWRFKPWEDVDGMTVVVDVETETWVWSVCRKPDQFSRRYGRLSALNKLADKLGIKRSKRFFRGGKFYIIPEGENISTNFTEWLDLEHRGLKEYPDIREELKWAQGG